MWQKVAKFKGAEYFRKALYILAVCCSDNLSTVMIVTMSVMDGLWSSDPAIPHNLYCHLSSSPLHLTCQICCDRS